ncbi:MAG: hypothetical protein ACREL3_00215 [Gemmatimonadales bacterium]
MAASWRTDWRVGEASRVDPESKRAAQQARAREERRQQAETNAHQILAEARRGAPTLIIPHTLRLVSRALQVDHVTLTIGPQTLPHAVFYANARDATSVSWPGHRSEAEPPVSPLVDGAVSRLYAFVYGIEDPEPRGCLSLHSMRPRSFRAAEVALVDALAELLIRELEQRSPVAECG